MRKISLTLLVIFINVEAVLSQQVNSALLNKHWTAHWIAVPDATAKGYGVYYFRKQFSLGTKPENFIVHVSGDNRYALMVNEKLVSLGPARNDLNHWNFETVNLAPLLVQGDNLIAAVVWNEGEHRPEGQISNRTGFLLQGNTSNEEIVNTNDRWKCLRSTAYTALAGGVGYNTYYVSGPGELIDMHAMPDGWMKNDFNDNDWPNAVRVGWRTATPKGTVDIADWMLVPSPLPQMEVSPQRFA